MTAPSRAAVADELEALAISFVSIIQDGIAQEAGSKSIAGAIINELLARRVLNRHLPGRLDCGELPSIPDDDSDFTPELARKIVAKYQEIIKANSHDASKMVPEAVISDGSQGPDTEMQGRLPRDANISTVLPPTLNSGAVREIARKAGDDAYKRWTGRHFSLDGMQEIADAIITALTRAVEGGAIDFEYTNWEGRKSLRRARPISIRFGTSEWHPRPQWLMLGFDTDKGAEREFAMADMQFEDDSLAALALSHPKPGDGERWTDEELASAKDEAKRLHDYFHVHPSDGGVAGEPVASKRPVAFRVIGENGGQVLFHNEDAAQEYAERNRVDYQGLYVRDGSALPQVPGNEGREAIIEKCARIAERGCLVPPDGGSPTVEEKEMCDGIARAIRGLSHSRSKCGGAA